MRAEAVRRIAVVTAGHLSTCPRMLKAADALAAAGYGVRVIATRHEPWATIADVDVRSRRTWPVTVVDYRRDGAAPVYWWTGVQHRVARAAVRTAGVGAVPFGVAARAFGRVHGALVRAILAEPADLVYGGTTGALAAIEEAARRAHTPYAIDLEDLHSAETTGAAAPLIGALAARIERRAIAGARFVTTSSAAIAGAYRDRYGVDASVIHNTFPLPPRIPDFGRIDPAVLRLYWFSQTIGPHRGLERAVAALGRVGVAAQLTVLGRPDGGFVNALRAAAHAVAPSLRVVHQPPAPPDTMVDCARGHDIGLALDGGVSLNRELCITNKAFTYILAGVPVVMTDTPGHHDLGRDLGRAAALVDVGDVDALAAAIARWAKDPAALECAKRTAWAAATRRWHWEHDDERGVLYRLVGEALS